MICKNTFSNFILVIMIFICGLLIRHEIRFANIEERINRIEESLSRIEAMLNINNVNRPNNPQGANPNNQGENDIKFNHDTNSNESNNA